MNRRRTEEWRVREEEQKMNNRWTTDDRMMNKRWLMIDRGLDGGELIVGDGGGERGEMSENDGENVSCVICI